MGSEKNTRKCGVNSSVSPTERSISWFLVKPSGKDSSRHYHVRRKWQVCETDNFFLAWYLLYYLAKSANCEILYVLFPAPFPPFLLDLNIALLVLLQALWNYIFPLDKYLWFQTNLDKIKMVTFFVLKSLGSRTGLRRQICERKEHFFL